jgi:hypothetical protein
MNSLGEVDVAADILWGAQTQRSQPSFPNEHAWRRGIHTGRGAHRPDKDGDQAIRQHLTM